MGHDRRGAQGRGRVYAGCGVFLLVACGNRFSGRDKPHVDLNDGGEGGADTGGTSAGSSGSSVGGGFTGGVGGTNSEGGNSASAGTATSGGSAGTDGSGGSAGTDDGGTGPGGSMNGGSAGSASGGTGGRGGASGSAGAGNGGAGGKGGTNNAGSGGSAGSNNGGSGGKGGTSTGGSGGKGGTSTGGVAGSGGKGGTGGIAPCTSEILVNGDFDDGPSGWTTETSDSTPVIFHRTSTALVNRGIDTHSPNYLAWLGGLNYRTARVYRTVTLPIGSQTIRVVGYYRIFTGESNERVYDDAYVELVQGTSAYALRHWTNIDVVNAWTRFEASIAANVFGQGPISFQLRSTVDVSAESGFFFDSISLTAECN